MTGEPISDGKYNRWPPGDGAGRGGRFAPKNGTPAEPSRRRRRGSAAASRPPAGGPPVPAGGPVNLATATVDELTDAFRALSAQPPGTPGLDEQLLALDAELARREGVDRLTVEDSPQSRQIDDLTAAGWSFLDAYAEVHHLDVRQLEREQRMSMVEAEHRPGERRAKTIRRMYFEYTALAVLQAEDETAGVLLSRAGRAKGIDPASLWSGPAARARKYASDELKQWWSEHGGRITLTEWAAQFTGDRKGAEKARMSGQGRDYGI